MLLVKFWMTLVIAKSHQSFSNHPTRCVNPSAHTVLAARLWNFHLFVKVVRVYEWLRAEYSKSNKESSDLANEWCCLLHDVLCSSMHILNLGLHSIVGSSSQQPHHRLEKSFYSLFEQRLAASLSNSAVATGVNGGLKRDRLKKKPFECLKMP